MVSPQMVGKKYRPFLCGLRVSMKQELLRVGKPLLCQAGHYEYIEIEVVKLGSNSDAVFEQLPEGFLENVIVNITIN